MDAGDRLGKYTLLRKIATGGMAEVYLAVQEGPEGFRKPVAIKRILPHLASDPQFVKMFLAEARIAAQLSHANVVQIFDLGVDVHGNYLAMEYVFGESLARLLARLAHKGKRLPLAAGLFVAENLCLALHHAHTFAAGKSPQPIIHRDVSPHNVLVGFEGAVKLTDFGVAKVKGAQGNTTLGIIKGKVGYMAPEQIEGEPVDARSDLFALGIVLYELCTGEAPFKGNSVRAVFDAVTKAHPPPPSSLAPCGPDLNALILRALEKDREKRHQSASDFLDALEDARQEMGLKTNPLAFGRTVSEAFGPLPEGRDEGQSVVSSILTYLDARTDNPTAPPTRSSGSRDLEKTLVRDRSGGKSDG